jgi:DNA topoisomerase IB
MLLWFDYDAKSVQHGRRAVVAPAVLAVVRTLRRRRTGPGDELLAYKDDAGRWVDVTADDINGYLREHLGDEFSAKDFRTWVGTVLTAVVLADRERPASEAARRKQVRQAVNEVAEHLGNTPAVARSAYIDPRVVDGYEADETIARALSDGGLDRIERAVRRLVASR